jgi:hypothetical protein
MTHFIHVSREGYSGGYYLARLEDEDGNLIIAPIEDEYGNLRNTRQWVHSKSLDLVIAHINQHWPGITVRTSQELAARLRQAGYQGEVEA